MNVARRLYDWLCRSKRTEESVTLSIETEEKYILVNVEDATLSWSETVTGEPTDYCIEVEANGYGTCQKETTTTEC